MAFVILSTGGLTRSRTHTLSARMLGLALGAVLLGVLGGGMAIGYRMAAPAPELASGGVEAVPVTLDHAEGRVLVDRVGELAGRLIRLESEASTLAKRVGVLQEFEEQIAPAATGKGAASTARGSAAPARAGAGGPLVPAVGLTVDEAAQAGSVGDFGIGLAALENQLDRIDLAFSLVDRAATERNLQHMAFPSRVPVEGRPITSGFGNRLDPFTRRLARHTGVDFPAPTGTPILASAGGRVKFAAYNRDYGNMVEIDHGNGLLTRYAHASRLFVRVGDVVMPGQRIAAVGSTGRSTGPHLHFEVMRNGSHVDPKHYLVRAGS
ncbi:M23 family metallopeptidase [Pseudothauera lacus]|uniref:M23 family peptidase n=1 Tax=Pseudothauera lacus TaxID=2136175 RepID=A0A2T4IK79_9RHOO|nr:M23 family metallopeptidase [Pseudothauera lacus]PTD98169.1 M23 family peptidase [Pseudothauera lacus]